ncbi:MAG: CatB-related O-acetyltransferase [Sedimentisphaerales bacterium]|nr:CatB-related O-acetyltransferase [Sedimentisphaerales bacterium]
MLFKLYRYRNKTLRSIILRLVQRREGGAACSVTLRRIFKEYYGIEVGLYTHGGWCVPDAIGRFTKIGRYCSIASNVRVFTRNHPLEYKSTHAFFFNPVMGIVPEDTVEYNPLEIGNDVWMGDGARILPSVKTIGDGAVIGTHAVVNKDVPPYAVAVGNPARVVRYRFSQEVIDRLLKEKWWEKDIDEIKNHLEEYTQPYEAYLAARNLILGKKGEQDSSLDCNKQSDFVQ